MIYLSLSQLSYGYKCYSPQTKKCYMFVDVTFFEETLFFSSFMQDAGSIQQVLPVPSFGPMILPTQDPSDQEGHQPQSPIPSSADSASPSSPLRTLGAICSMPIGSLHSCPLPSTTYTTDPSSTSHPSEPSSDWPIAIRKGIRSIQNSHPIYNFLSYHHISPSYLPCRLLLFQKMFKRHLIILVGDKP